MIPINDPHTVKAFDTELERLNQMILRMGTLACAQLDASIHVIENGDLALAADTIAGDEAVDTAEESINEQVVKVLALHSPVANDLRIVISSLSVATALERVADHAASTARRAEVLAETPAFPAIRSVVRLGRLVHSLLVDAVDAFIARDVDRAYRIWERDSEVDGIYSALFRELLTYMLEDPRSIAPSIHLMMIAKNLERVGDHATTLAETTWFIVKGVPISEDRPKADETTTPPSLDPASAPRETGTPS